MGNGLFQIPQNIGKQWIDLTRDNKKLFINKITNQEFQLIDISKKEFRQHFKSLVQRSTYAIPKTPKIILLKTIKGKMCLLAQCYSEPLSKFASTILVVTDLLQFLREMMKVIGSLYKKYGAFTLTEGMVGINKSMQLMIWINEIRYKTEVQYQLQSCEFPEQKMISQTISMIKKLSSFPLNYECLANPSHHFTPFICSLTELINQIKNTKKPAYHVQAFKKVSPSKKSRPFQSIEASTIKKQMIMSEQMPKESRIPNFIKIKKNKTILLSSLRHRRAVSINQSNCFLSKLSRKTTLSPGLNFKSLDKFKSPREAVSPRGRFQTNPNSKPKDYRSTYQVGQTNSPLTASGVSSSHRMKRVTMGGKQTFKLNLKELPKTIKQFQPSSTTGVSTPKDQSFLFRSANKLPQNLKKNLPLVSLCPNTSQSKYFTDEDKKQQRREGESGKHKFNSKTIEQQLCQMFSNPPKSPRTNFETCSEGLQLMQQFGKLMNFN